MFFRSICCLILVLTFSVSTLTASVVLKGTAKQYAGMNLVVQKYSDYISRQANPIATIKVKQNGLFETEIITDEICMIFIDLGRYRANMFVEPEKKYQIILPPNDPRPDAERFNPFFVNEEIIIGISDDYQGLNQAIDELNERYELAYNQNAVDLVRRNFIRLGDQMMAGLDSLPNADGHPFYLDYRKYRKVMFYALPRSRQTTTVIGTYFSSSPVLFNNPAYWETFHYVFSGYIDSYARTAKGRPFATAWNKGVRFDSLSTALSTDTLFKNRELTEVVLLKFLHDSYYSGKLSFDKVALLLSEAGQFASTPNVRGIAANILLKIGHLKVGTPAPNFTLKTFKGKDVELAKLKGKFIYIAFLHTQNFACLKDMAALTVLSERFKKEMVILGVVTNEDPEEAERYFKKNKVPWQVVTFTAGQKIVFDYNISALPSYFLVNPDGVLASSPAPGPNESFDKTFADIFLAYRNQQIRKEKPKEKTIYDMF